MDIMVSPCTFKSSAIVPTPAPCWLRRMLVLSRPKVGTKKGGIVVRLATETVEPKRVAWTRECRSVREGKERSCLQVGRGWENSVDQQGVKKEHLWRKVRVLSENQVSVHVLMLNLVAGKEQNSVG